jgi:hypothetical protein
MKRWSTLVLASALVSLYFVDSATRAFAFDFQIANPVTAGNLGVYFVDGKGPGGGGMLSLDQAMAQGTAKIYQQTITTRTDPATRHDMYLNGPVAIQNLSATQSIFIQVGDLVRGGLQDQLVTRTIIVPPGSGRVTLETLCVDPFRSVARQGESAETFSAPGALFPWRLAKLSSLAAETTAGPVETAVRRVRQMGVWWSIDSLRYRLSQQLGVPLEPASTPHWDPGSPDLRLNAELSGRHSQWKTSLPLALENPQLARAEQPYLDALQGKVGRHEIIGAIFVINGQIEGADIYRSHELFAQMWPKLLRAYAAEALALSGSKPAHPPTLRRVREFMATAERAPARDFGGGNLIHEGKAAVYAVASSKGAWVYRSYVAKYASDRSSPEGLLVNMLDSGEVAGHPIAGLTADQTVVLRRVRGVLTGAVIPNPNNVQTTHATRFPLTPVAISQITRGAPASFDGRWAATNATRLDVERALAPVHQTRNPGGVRPWLIELAAVLVAGLLCFLIGWIRDSGPARAATKPFRIAESAGRKRVAGASWVLARFMRPGIKAPPVEAVLRPVGAPSLADAPQPARRHWQVIKTQTVRPHTPLPESEPFEFKKAA